MFLSFSIRSSKKVHLLATAKMKARSAAAPQRLYRKHKSTLSGPGQHHHWTTKEVVKEYTDLFGQRLEDQVQRNVLHSQRMDKYFLAFVGLGLAGVVSVFGGFGFVLKSIDSGKQEMNLKIDSLAEEIRKTK